MSEHISIIFRHANVNFCFATIIAMALFIKRLSKQEIYIFVIILISYLIDVGSEFIKISDAAHQSNHWVFNYSLPILYLSYILYYAFLLPNNNSILRVLFTSILVTITHIVFLIVFGVTNFLTYSIIPYILLVGLASFIYLQKITITENTPLGKNLIFWFSMANVIKHIATIPVISTLSWYPELNQDWASNILIINDYLSYYIYYSIIILGVIWTKLIRA